MLDKKDFLEFCDQLMAMEVEMEHEAKTLQKYIKDEKAVALLKRIHADEIRHEGIVKQIRKIINDNYAKN